MKTKRKRRKRTLVDTIYLIKNRRTNTYLSRSCDAWSSMLKWQGAFRRDAKQMNELESRRAVKTLKTNSDKCTTCDRSGVLDLCLIKVSLYKIE